MCHHSNPMKPATPGSFVCDDTTTSPAGSKSRRQFLKSGVGIAAGGSVAQMLQSGKAVAQVADTGNSDAELSRVQGKRRILFKGGVVLTLDPQVGDFAKADVLIEDGKIREISPNIAVPDETAIVDATNRIVLPGFIDTHHH